MSTGLLLLTIVHVAISLLGIGAGFIVMRSMLLNNRISRGTDFFLIMTVATSATGFLFPFKELLPSHHLGILSLIALTFAIYALYARRLRGKWRAVYVTTAILSQYFNVFVLIVQSFQKIPFLNVLAPTQTSPGFVVVQLATLAGFVAFGCLTLKRFHPATSRSVPDAITVRST